MHKEDDWKINENGHLHKVYKFPNFIKTMEFANKITTLAEAANHHPELIIAWGKCEVILWTHDTNSVTDKDHALAKKIEEIK